MAYPPRPAMEGPGASEGKKEAARLSPYATESSASRHYRLFMTVPS